MMKTTTEEIREQSHDDLVNNLQGLLEKNYDAEEGYKKAMLKAEGEFLTEYLKNRAVLRNRFATELSDAILKLNETPIASGSTAGTLHRTWMNIKEALSSNSDEAIMEEVIRGEKDSVEEYRESLDKNFYPPHITSMITNQMIEVEQSLKEMKNLEQHA